MGILKGEGVSFYPVERIVLMIKFDKVGCVDLIGVFPSIVAFGVSFPLDKVLEFSRPSMTSVAPYHLHLILRFSIN